MHTLLLVHMPIYTNFGSQIVESARPRNCMLSVPDLFPILRVQYAILVAHYTVHIMYGHIHYVTSHNYKKLSIHN